MTREILPVIFKIVDSRQSGQRYIHIRYTICIDRQTLYNKFHTETVPKSIKSHKTSLGRNHDWVIFVFHGLLS